MLFSRLDPRHLADAPLQSLTLEVYIPNYLSPILIALGRVANLTRLESVTVVFGLVHQTTYPDEIAWRQFDVEFGVLLKPGNALKEVTISLGAVGPSVAGLLRSWMPALDAKGVLRVDTRN